uniref:Dermatan-sulfate epimerase-like protein n=1 Tax=Phallusia mammillata TaxID=59560 RepID=A0A6F9DB88_9ASCI|nr:dermatan-sulfate epimerase-like protein [Phallusia mammillata]
MTTFTFGFNAHPKINRKTVWYNKLLPIVVAVLLCICTATASKPLQSNDRDSEISHPLLFFNKEDVPKLRLKAKTTHVKIARILQDAGKALTGDSIHVLPPESAEKFASAWNEIYGNNLCAFAMYCVLYPEDTKALELIKVFMDRMVSYPDWYVAASRGVDEVPIGHHLAGFATAFDFLYDQLEPKRIEKYLTKIREITRQLYTVVYKVRSGWAKQLIHNHAPTNNLALLLGAMILEKHEAPNGPASQWRALAVDHFEKGLFLLSFVADGSSDEGVAYGSYSSRGWTQYAFLAKRHFQKDHSQNPWFLQHFWFFYATILPGYQRTVGIADSNYNWFYGPESQLVFLDSFVMRNGYGNWLADKIRQSKPKNPPLARAPSQKWSTVHTEFIFYDSTIAPVHPCLPSGTKLHVFHDWGVATYGSGQAHSPGNTFLSLKSGAIHGEAISHIVENNLLSSFVKQWKTFNAGHEHPDQNSFVFAPNGRFFITEALYSVKMTYLNNVLTFWPDQTSKCNTPWVGQAGECSRWLNYQAIPAPRGHIVTATQSGEMVHLAGESANAYSPHLGLKSVQRNMILMHPEVLLLVDSVYLHPTSKMTRVATYFHNILNSFHQYTHLGFNGAQMVFPEGPYTFFWFQPGGFSPPGSLQKEKIACESKFRTTHFVNVTYDLHPSGVTHIAYLFTGPKIKVQEASFVMSQVDDFTHIGLRFNNVNYDVTIASLTMELEKRMVAFGFGAFASVKTESKNYVFGQSHDTPVTWDRCDVINNDVTGLSTNLVKTLVSTNDQETNALVLAKHNQSDSSFFGNLVMSFLFAMLAMLIFAGLFFIRRRQYVSSRTRRLCRVGCVLGIIFLIYFYKIMCVNCPFNESERSYMQCSIPNPIETLVPEVPATVFVASLPGSGGELLQHIFANSSEFLYIRGRDITMPLVNYDVAKYNPCYWPTTGKEAHPRTAAWFSMISEEPELFLENLKGDKKYVNTLKKSYAELNLPKFVISLLSGFWNSKLSWILKQAPDQTRFILVVRDPRDWVYSLTREDLNVDNQLLQYQTVHRILTPEAFKCLRPSWLPWEFRDISEHNQASTVEQLAKVWVADVAAMLRTGRSFQIVRYEDLLQQPEKAAKIMARLGTTITLPQINKLARAVRSRHLSFGHEPAVHHHTVDQWRDKMSFNDVRAIEKICGDMMEKLMYI